MNLTKFIDILIHSWEREKERTRWEDRDEIRFTAFEWRVATFECVG
jgi:hypothetical protein